jgi:hypothetical protein
MQLFFAVAAHAFSMVRLTIKADAEQKCLPDPPGIVNRVVQSWRWPPWAGPNDECLAIAAAIG